MSLRDHMQSDLAMMLNADEFAEAITLCGVPLTAIVDISKESASYEDRPSVFVETATIRIAEEFVTLPDVGRQVEFNGEEWVMGQIDDEDGLVAIRIWRDAA